MQENIKTVLVKKTVRNEFKTANIVQYDVGHILSFEGFDLPEAFEVHFSLTETGEAVTQVGSEGEVAVPDILVQDGRWLYAWLYISDEETGLTKFTIQIPVTRRAKPTDQVPTPVEQSEIQQAIAALNTGVARAETAAENAEQSEGSASQYAENAYNSSEAAANAAESAEGDARTATQKAQEALTSALDADRKAQNASESAQLASQKASEASGYADSLAEAVRTANEAKQTAVSKATEATQSASNAAQKAQEALSSAQAAEGYANDAYTAKQGAESARDAAQGYAGNASIMAQEANQSKNTAVEKAGEASQSATNAAQSAQAAQQTAQQFSAKISEIDQELNTLSGDVSDLSDSLSEHEQYAEDTYAKQDGYYSDLTAGNAEQLVSSKLTEDQVPYKLRPAGGTNDIGNREYKEAIVGGTIAWNQLVRDEASDNETDYADVVTVTDAVEDTAGVKVKIEPVQDLHGYDHPWPAGGGKNLLKSTAQSITKDGISFIVNDDGSVLVNGTATANTELVLTTDAIDVPGDYIVNGCPDGGNRQYWMNFKRTVNGISEWKQEYGSGFTVTGGTIQNVGVFVQRDSTLNNVLFKPMIRLASETDATYAPYSNICPITGWDGVKVTRTGKNLFGGEYNEFFPIHFPVDTVICASADKRNDQYTPQIGFYDKNKAQIDYWGMSESYSTIAGRIARSFTLPKETYYVRFITYSAENMQIEFGTTNSPYEPYSGNTYSISFPLSAGTVYGGELTVNADGSGSLVVDRARAKVSDLTVNGGLNVGTYTVMRRFFLPSLAIAVLYNQKHGAIGSMGAEGSAYYGSNRTSDAGSTEVDFGITANGDLLAIYDKDLTLTSDAFMEKYGDAVIVYPLAAPITYTLTATQVRTLLGTNNVWADSGDVALTYTGTDEHITLTNGRKYLTRISGTDSMVLGAGQEITAVKGTDNVFDLTQMFGTSVADYVYGQGAEYFRKWFTGAVYAYNPGALISVSGLQSHDTVGFNLWDEEWEVGEINGTTGANANTGYAIRSKNYIHVVGGQTYYAKIGSSWINVYQYETNDVGGYIGQVASPTNSTFTLPDKCRYIRFATGTAYGTTYNHDICINLSNSGSRNGEYEPYVKRSYPLDSSVILRGVPKTGSNGVYWDGDRYLPDGTVERRYGVVAITDDMISIGGASYSNIVFGDIRTPGLRDYYKNGVLEKYGVVRTHSGAWDSTSHIGIFYNDATVGSFWIGYPHGTSLDAIKADLVGKILVYELATPTTETADPYRELQIVDDWGTEEFVTTGLVPVGHETQYPANLRDKLQHLPDLASSNGIYIVKQTDSEMELLKLPDMPTTNGNYRLKLNVASGSPTFSWEVVS